MARVKGCEAVYEIADQWRERCLERDGSLLWPDLEEPTWTVENIEIVEMRLEQSPQRKRKSWDLLLQAIENDPPSISRLVSDLIAIWSLNSWVPAQRKRQWIQLIMDVAAKNGSSAPELELFNNALEDVAVAEMYLGDDPTRRNPQMSVYLALALRVKLQSISPSDSSKVHAVVYEIAMGIGWGINSAASILHRLYPDQYEALSHEDKLRVVKTFHGRTPPDAGNIDNELEEIRKEIVAEIGRPDFSFLDDDIKSRWKRKLDASKSPAGTSMDRNYWLFQANPDVYDYATQLRKMDIGQVDDWTLSRYRNEVQIGDPIILWQSGPVGGVLALGEIASEPFERPESAVSTLGEASHEWAINYRLTHKVTPRLSRESLKHHPILGGLAVFSQPQGSNFTVTSEQWLALQDLIEQHAESSIDELGRLSFLDRTEFDAIEQLLLDKKQLIFEGPPGSGKTFLARLFARYLAELPLEGDPDPQVEIVQFHQSYGYEDFVAGIRPRTTPEGTIRYDVQPGIFIEMCKRAEANPTKNFVLIIDEINRGNLSRIFGELLYALEYRDEPVRIQYPDMMGDESADHLTIPKNLYLIGTMNSTDRSLAMIDYALRRRFYFWTLMPVVDHQAPVLDGWLRARGVDEDLAQRLLSRFVAFNERIAEHMSPDHQIGHSYLMVDELEKPETLERVWRRALLPLLGEYFHNRRDREALIDELRVIMLGS